MLALYLREPLALRQTAIQRDPARLPLGTGDARRNAIAADAPTLVKANVPVNFLLPPARRGAARDAPAILLYLPLRAYLLAILRDENHRGWLRHVTTQLAPYVGDWSALNDAERGAALWLAQVETFTAALSATARRANARCRNAVRLRRCRSCGQRPRTWAFRLGTKGTRNGRRRPALLDLFEESERCVRQCRATRPRRAGRRRDRARARRGAGVGRAQGFDRDARRSAAGSSRAQSLTPIAGCPASAATA